MLSPIYLFLVFTISSIILTINCAPTKSEASDAVEFNMNAEEKSYNNDQTDLSNQNLPVERFPLPKREYPTEGILLGRREYPTEGILLGRREYPTEGILLGRREYPTEGILLGKRDYPTEGILLGKREYPTEGILLGKRNFRFFAPPKSSGWANHQFNN